MAYNINYAKETSYIVPIAQMLIRGCCFSWFIKPFTKNRKTPFCVFIVYFLVMFSLYTMPLYIKTYLAYCTGVISSLIIICCMELNNYKQKIFLTIIFFTLNWFASAMSEVLYDNIYKFLLDTAYMHSHQDMQPVLYIAVCILYLVLEFIFTLVCIFCIIKVYQNKYINISQKELFMLATPSVMGLTGYEIMRYYRNFYIIETGEIINIYDIMLLLYCIVSVVTIIIVIVLYQKIKIKQEEKMQAGLLAVQIDSIKKHICQVENFYNDIRSLRHDMASHILTLENLYAGNKKAEASAYSKKLKTELKNLAGEIKSGNPVTDVVLQEFKDEAEKRGINFYSEFYYPADSGIDAFDTSIILNNALQNAIENTIQDSNGCINIISYRRNNAYMIEISNSFNGSLQWDTVSGLPVTSKGKNSGHGYGLFNIQKTARQYMGDIDISLKNGKFCLCIMLMAK